VCYFGYFGCITEVGLRLCLNNNVLRFGLFFGIVVSSGIDFWICCWVMTIFIAVWCSVSICGIRVVRFWGVWCLCSGWMCII